MPHKWLVSLSLFCRYFKKLTSQNVCVVKMDLWLAVALLLFFFWVGRGGKLSLPGSMAAHPKLFRTAPPASCSSFDNYMSIWKHLRNNQRLFITKFDLEYLPVSISMISISTPSHSFVAPNLITAIEWLDIYFAYLVIHGAVREIW